MNSLKAQISELKKEMNAVILAHYYVDGEIQEIADYVGDSYYLSDVARGLKEDVIVFCGVTFMGESAKILNPTKKVLLPDTGAVCPMAGMVDLNQLANMRETVDDLAVVCYINSSTEVKAHCDVCVTSANALTVVSNLPQKNILFVPDGNLGSYIASKLPEKNIYLGNGYCHVHRNISLEDVETAKTAHPGVKVLAHPECKFEVSSVCDYVGSTTGIIKYANESDDKEFIVATETGVFYELIRQNPDKKFYPVNDFQICNNMKKLTLEKVYDCMVKGIGEVELDKTLADAANKPLVKMLELAKKGA